MELRTVFEIGRTEWLRSLGVTYKYMEKQESCYLLYLYLVTLKISIIRR